MLVRTVAALLIAVWFCAPLSAQGNTQKPAAPRAADFDAAREKAIDAFLKGDLDDALAQFNALITKGTIDDVLFAYRAAIYLEKRDFEKADADLKSALEANPNSMLGYHNRGYGHWLRGRFAEAVNDYSSAISLGISRHARREVTAAALATMYQNRGVAFEDMTDLDRAAIDFTRCIQLQPERGTYYENRALIYLKRGLFAEGITDLDEALFLDPLNAQTRVNRAYASYLMEDYDGAVRDYTRALYLKPEYLNALVGRGNAQVARGKLDDAAGDFNQVLKLKPGYASALSGLGLVAAQRGQWPEAEKQYQLAASAGGDAGTWRGLAVSQWKQGKTEPALDAYQQAARRGASENVMLEMAQLCSELGRLEDALVALNQALESNPRHLASRRLRASIHGKRKEWRLALADAETALHQSAADPELYLDKAALHVQRAEKDDTTAALACVTKAASLGQSAESLRKDERLAGLRKDPRFEAAVTGK
ncbi:MAG: tetratricopeptide repeat protein [Planctomycetes bacterium]|nr:tetratricopeptide repeat protein [Planctomycetota bacterium]